MKLKIVSDGTSKGTKLVNNDTGEEIVGVIRLYWCASKDSPIVNCTVFIDGVSIEFDDQTGRSNTKVEEVKSV